MGVYCIFFHNLSTGKVIYPHAIHSGADDFD